MKSVSTTMLTCLGGVLLFYREERGMPTRYTDVRETQRRSKHLETCLAQEIPEPGMVHGRVLRENLVASHCSLL